MKQLMMKVILLFTAIFFFLSIHSCVTPSKCDAYGNERSYFTFRINKSLKFHQSSEELILQMRKNGLIVNRTADSTSLGKELIQLNSFKINDYPFSGVAIIKRLSSTKSKIKIKSVSKTGQRVFTNNHKFKNKVMQKFNNFCSENRISNKS